MRGVPRRTSAPGTTRRTRARGVIALIGWGPYLWTNGTRGRKDGFVWTCADTRPSDGTHPSATGQAKVAALLWIFFSTDRAAKSWFLD